MFNQKSNLNTLSHMSYNEQDKEVDHSRMSSGGDRVPRAHTQVSMEQIDVVEGHKDMQINKQRSSMGVNMIVHEDAKKRLVEVKDVLKNSKTLK